MLAPDRMPMAEGKKMANTLKKFSSFDLQFGFRFDMKISPGDRQKERFMYDSVWAYVDCVASDE